MGIGTPALWVGFLGAVLGLLALDLFVFHRTPHAVSAREALKWSAFWIGLALAFNGFIALRFGADAGLDFLTAYLVEKSLSVDNLFVFIVVFASFGVAPQAQHRLLFWGVLGALLMRAGLIFGGIALLERFAWLVYPMGAFLLLTGLKLFRDRHEAEQPVRFVEWLKRRAPSALGAGLLALVAIELTDVVFAVDSVPAVLAVTEDPFIVFTSNICALLGLRSLFFALADVMTRFRYLKVSLAGVLAFVGLKMLASSVLHVPHVVSLGAVVAMLAAGVLASIARERRAQLPASIGTQTPPVSGVPEQRSPVSHPLA
jgi:tellurite resistance protein TerC